MNTLKIVSVLLVLFLVGCVESNNLGESPSSAPTNDPSAIANGQPCSSNIQCATPGYSCFNTANGGVCKGPNANCYPVSCQTNFDCCVGSVCSGNVCQNPSLSASISPGASGTPSATLSKSLSPVALTPGQISSSNEIVLSVPSPQALGITGGRLIAGINGNTDVISFTATSGLITGSQQASTIEASYTSGEFFGTYNVSNTAYVWIANAGTGSTTCNRYRSSATDNTFTQDASFNCGASNGLTADYANNFLYVGSSATSQASVTTYDLTTLAKLDPIYQIPETNQTEITNIITCPGGLYVLASFATPNNFFYFSTQQSDMPVPELAINLDTASRPLPIGATMDPTCTYLYVSGFSTVDVYRAPFSSTSKPIQSFGVGSGLEGIVYDSTTTPNRVFVASSQDNSIYGLTISS